MMLSRRTTISDSTLRTYIILFSDCSISLPPIPRVILIFILEFWSVRKRNGVYVAWCQALGGGFSYDESDFATLLLDKKSIEQHFGRILRVGIHMSSRRDEIFE